jgi:hypothetical protein
MDHGALARSQSVDHLYKALHAVEAACSTIERQKTPQVHLHLDSLKRRLTRFVGMDWPASVLDGVAEFYTDLASVITYNLGRRELEPAQKVARIEELFVSLLPSDPYIANVFLPLTYYGQ